MIDVCLSYERLSKRMGSLHRGGPGDTYSQLGEVPTGAPRAWFFRSERSV